MSTNTQIAMSTPDAADRTSDSETAWQQLTSRDPEAKFFYAVTTTGVFCRPSCKSRLPLRANVRFFAITAEAQAAGFRACKRCRPLEDGPSDKVAAGIERVRTYLERNADRRVRLEDSGQIAGLSPFTVQRLFKQADGREPAAISARAAGRQPAQLAEAGRHGDRCDL